MHEAKVTLPGCISGIFSLSVTKIGMEPRISITAKSVKKTVRISLKFMTIGMGN